LAQSATPGFRRYFLRLCGPEVIRGINELAISVGSIAPNDGDRGT
jgi:hypothetical protein